jgi:hypothetical protein
MESIHTASPELLGALGKYTILNLGDGRKCHSDTVNVDLVADTNPKLAWDLNRIPWPLPSDHCREVLASMSSSISIRSYP